jgi:hypothetical protein
MGSFCGPVSEKPFGAEYDFHYTFRYPSPKHSHRIGHKSELFTKRFKSGIVRVFLDQIIARFSENRVYKEFFNLTRSPQRSFVLLSAKDNGSMLRPDQIRDVKKMDTRFTTFLEEIEPTTGLRSCDPLCNLNKPFHLISV